MKRCLDRKAAAAYVDLSPNAFDKAVQLGELPEPIAFVGIKRHLWDIKAIDAVIDRKSGVGGSSPTDNLMERISAL